MSGKSSRWALVALVFLGAATARPADEPVAGPERFVVVLDPGHGGSEKGAVGVSGALEKTVVLQVSKSIRRALEAQPGIQVVMTRERDVHVPLDERVVLAERVGADLFVSIHANAFVRRSFGGVETFFHAVEASDDEARRVAQAENAVAPVVAAAGPDPVQSILADMRQAETLRDSSRFAHLVQAELAAALPFPNLGVRQADFVVLRGRRMPAVLLELGFMTNKREERALRQPDNQARIGAAVVRAVCGFRELMRRKRLAPLPAPGAEP